MRVSESYMAANTNQTTDKSGKAVKAAKAADGQTASAKKLAKPSRPRRARGEQTRREILEATLRVIAKQGHRSLTHRSVAEEAGLNYSLTTYYFKDLDELIAEAIRFYIERGEPEIGLVWSEVFNYLDQFTKAEMRKRVVREEICDYLTQTACNYMLHQIQAKPEGLIVEMTYSFDAHVAPELRQLAREYRSHLLQGFSALCQRLGSPSPELDATLCLSTLQRLEYQGLVNPEELGREEIYRQMHRQMQWLLAL